MSTTLSARLTRAESEASPFAGFTTMLRLMWRLDRIKLTVWVAAITGATLIYGATIDQVYTTITDLEAAAASVQGPIGALLVGPTLGFDEITTARYFAAENGLYLMIACALMSIFAIGRHTRSEEASGRAELMRANVVGRYATLAAALTLTVLAQLVIGILVGLALPLLSDHYTLAGSTVFGGSLVAVGIVFAAIAALTAQLTDNPGAANGMAIGSLCVAFLIRGIGDMLEEGGSLLSWFSPLGWAQQTGPFVYDRWWPLGISLLFSAAIVALAFYVSTRRDVGAGIIPPRTGSATAAEWIQSPWAVATKLRYTSLLWWAFGFGITCLLMGGLTQNLLDASDDLPDLYDEIFGQGDAFVGSFINVMSLYVSLIIGAYVMLGLQFIRTEESTGRAETILATATSRRRWLLGVVAVVGVGALVLHVVAGLALGIGAAVSTGDGSLVLESVNAQLAFVPATLVVLGLGTAIFGFRPHWLGAAWIVVIYGIVVVLFGQLLTEFPDWVRRISPYDLVPQLPVESFDPVPTIGLTLLGLALIVPGLRGFDARDVNVR